MKKIYVIGAVAIILLSLATVDYYFNNKLPENQQARYVGNNHVIANSLNSNPNKEASTPNAETSIYTSRKREIPYVNNKRSAKSSSFTETPSENNTTLQLANVQKPVTDLKVETPRVFYANFNDEPPLYYKRPGHLNFGLEVGMNSYGFYQNTGTNTMANSFHAGALLNIYLNNHFALQPGLMYEKRGSTLVNNTQSSGTMDVTTSNNYSLNYIEMPLNLVYKFGNPNTARFFVGGGPYIAYLVSSNTSVTTSSIDDNVNNNSNNPTYASRTTTISANQPLGTFGAANPALPDAPGSAQGGLTDDFRKLDYGAGLFVGCELPKGFFAKAGGEIGFRDIQQNTDGGYNNRNYGFGVSIGQFIGR